MTIGKGKFALNPRFWVVFGGQFGCFIVSFRQIVKRFSPRKPPPRPPLLSDLNDGMTTAQFGSNPPQPTGHNEAEKARPPAKRGALKPETVFLDYLRGTVPPLVFPKIGDELTGEVIEYSQPNFDLLESLFGKLTPLQGNSAKGYTHSAVMACGGSVHWHETKPEQRILINLGGQALADLGQGPMELLKSLAAMDFQATRLDWAKDDKDKLLNLAEIERKMLAGDLVTRFTKYGVNISGTFGDQGQQQGKTYFLGIRTSVEFFRIYVKSAEQGRPDEHHIRVELEIKKRKAQKLMADILSKYQAGKDVVQAGKDVVQHLLGVFYGLLDFKERSEVDAQKSRWETSAWWSEFLTVSEKVKVAVEKSETTLERAKDWVYGQVGIVAGMINEIEPGFLQMAASDGRDRMKEHHRLKLDRWRGEVAQRPAMAPI